MRRRKKYHEPTKKQEEDTLVLWDCVSMFEDTVVLWDCVSMFDTKDENFLIQGETPETNVTTRSQSLLKEDKSILPKIKKLQENMKKKHKNTVNVKIPEFSISSQDPKKINTPLKPIEVKIDNVKKNLKENEMGMILWKTLKKL